MIYYGCNDYRDYIAHHGVKGMHWGVRRYQNPDGTLTALGKRRLGEDDSGGLSDAGKGKLHGQVATDHRLASKAFSEVSKGANAGSNLASRREQKKKERSTKAMDLSHMSDKELQAAINRLNMERNYRSLTYENTMAGRTTASDVLKTVGDVAAIGASTAAIIAVLHQLRS